LVEERFAFSFVAVVIPKSDLSLERILAAVLPVAAERRFVNMLPAPLPVSEACALAPDVALLTRTMRF
jgi:hypothetical protein